MIIKLIVIILWLVYSVIEGYREAWYYYYRVKTFKNEGEDLHSVFFLQRGIPLLIIGYCLSWTLAIGCSLIFSFFHDGMYYVQRHKITNTIYPKGWFDDSDTSTAKLELKLWMRVLLLIIGLILLVYDLQN